MSHSETTQDPRPMSPEDFAELVSDAQSGVMGENFAFGCSANPEDHAHVQRCGAGSHSRVGLAVHDQGNAASVYVSPAQARRIAAALLNAADEIDGVTPLSFTE